MKGFDWALFKTGSSVVHCDTEEKANDFLNQAFEHGFTLLCESHLFDNLYADELENTCYRAGDDGDIWHSSLQFYCETGKKIIEWEIDEVKKFTEKDLKVGMLVKTKSFDPLGYGMIMPCEREGNVVAYKNERWGDIDLSRIAEVWGNCNCAYETLNFSTKHRVLLYEHKELKKMTVKEICKELGYDVEIVKE